MPRFLLLPASRDLFLPITARARRAAEVPHRRRRTGRTRTKSGRPRTKAPSPMVSLVDGEFPPAGSAHAISGELIQVDHLERRFHLRVDRNDSQDRGRVGSAARRGHASLRLDLLPRRARRAAGHSARHAPARPVLPERSQRQDAGSRTPLNNRKTPEVDFRRCFRLEDDFTFHARQKQLWKIDSVDLADEEAHRHAPARRPAVGKPQIVRPARQHARVRRARLSDLKSLQAGQTVLFNLTWVTLYGPGRITDIWLDEPSRALATTQQLERHRNHIRERGLPGWIDCGRRRGADRHDHVLRRRRSEAVRRADADINEEPHGWPLSNGSR